MGFREMWLNFRHDATSIFTAGHEKECVGTEDSQKHHLNSPFSSKLCIKIHECKQLGLFCIYHQ